MQIDVNSNAEEVANTIGKMRTTVTWKAMRRSITRTLQGTKAFASKEIRRSKVARLSAEEIKSGVLTRTTGERFGRSDSLGGSVLFDSRALSVTRFFARTVRVGRRIGVEVRSISGRKFRVGFPLESGKGGLRRIIRITDKTIVVKRKGPNRLPLEKVYGASLSDIVRQTALERNITSYAKGRLSKEMQQNLKHYLRQKGKSE